MSETQWEIIEDEAGIPEANRPKYKWVESTPNDYYQTKDGRLQTNVSNNQNYHLTPTTQRNNFSSQSNTDNYFVWEQYNHDTGLFIPSNPFEISKNKSALMSSSVGSLSSDRHRIF